MDLSDTRPFATVPLPPAMAAPEVAAAWAAHLDAGRIGVPLARAEGADFGCAGLARALGLAEDGRGPVGG